MYENWANENAPLVGEKTCPLFLGTPERSVPFSVSYFTGSYSARLAAKRMEASPKCKRQKAVKRICSEKTRQLTKEKRKEKEDIEHKT